MSFVLMGVLKSTIILACAALMTSAWRRGSASARHAIWALAIAGALVLPVAASLLPQFELPLLPVLPLSSYTLREVAAEQAGSPPGTLEASVSSESEDGAAARAATQLTGQAAGAMARAVSQGAALLPAVWLIGFLLVCSRFILAGLAAGRLTRHAVEIADPDWRELIDELCAHLAMTKPVRFLFYDGAISPMTWGFVRHVILLPANAAEWTPARRRLVLTHELAHVKRNDGLMQLVAQLACSVYWFNPIIWYAAHRLRLEREQACDDQVLNLGTSAEDYAGHLVEIARGLCHNATFTLAALSMAQPSQLEKRVQSILDARISRRSLSRPAAGSLLASIVLLTASLAAGGITTAAVPLPPVLSATPVAFPEPAPEQPVAKTPRRAAAPQRTRIGDVGQTAAPGVTPPQVVASTQPPYTRDAYANRIEGTVTIEAAVDARGLITVLRTVKGLGYGLDENAARGLGSWKFAPALRNGIAVDAVTQVEVDFSLAKDTSMNARVGGTVSAAGTQSRLTGVAVTATNTETGGAAAGLTDESGTYQFASLKPGTYKVSAELAGFKPQVFDSASFGPEQQIRLNFALERSATEGETLTGNGGPARIGPGVTPPRVSYRVEPEYSQEARDARYQGTVVLEVTIGSNGIVETVRVARSLGLGLDESAAEAVRQWKFEPATRDGKPVSVSLRIEVHFNLK